MCRSADDGHYLFLLASLDCLCQSAPSNPCVTRDGLCEFSENVPSNYVAIFVREEGLTVRSIAPEGVALARLFTGASRKIAEGRLALRGYGLGSNITLLSTDTVEKVLVRPDLVPQLLAAGYVDRVKIQGRDHNRGFLIATQTLPAAFLTVDGPPCEYLHSRQLARTTEARMRAVHTRASGSVLKASRGSDVLDGPIEPVLDCLCTEPLIGTCLDAPKPSESDYPMSKAVEAPPQYVSALRAGREVKAFDCGEGGSVVPLLCYNKKWSNRAYDINNAVREQNEAPDPATDAWVSRKLATVISNTEEHGVRASQLVEFNPPQRVGGVSMESSPVLPLPVTSVNRRFNPGVYSPNGEVGSVRRMKIRSGIGAILYWDDVDLPDLEELPRGAVSLIILDPTKRYHEGIIAAAMRHGATVLCAEVLPLASAQEQGVVLRRTTAGEILSSGWAHHTRRGADGPVTEIVPSSPQPDAFEETSDECVKSTVSAFMVSLRPRVAEVVWCVNESGEITFRPDEEQLAEVTCEGVITPVRWARGWSLAPDVCGVVVEFRFDTMRGMQAAIRSLVARGVPGFCALVPSVYDEESPVSALVEHGRVRGPAWTMQIGHVVTPAGEKIPSDRVAEECHVRRVPPVGIKCGGRMLSLGIFFGLVQSGTCQTESPGDMSSGERLGYQIAVAVLVIAIMAVAIYISCHVCRRREVTISCAACGAANTVCVDGLIIHEDRDTTASTTHATSPMTRTTSTTTTNEMSAEAQSDLSWTSSSSGTNSTFLAPKVGVLGSTSASVAKELRALSTSLHPDSAVETSRRVSEAFSTTASVGVVGDIVARIPDPLATGAVVIALASLFVVLLLLLGAVAEYRAMKGSSATTGMRPGLFAWMLKNAGLARYDTSTGRYYLATHVRKDSKRCSIDTYNVVFGGRNRAATRELKQRVCGKKGRALGKAYTYVHANDKACNEQHDCKYEDRAEADPQGVFDFNYEGPSLNRGMRPELILPGSRGGPQGIAHVYTQVRVQNTAYDARGNAEHETIAGDGTREVSSFEISSGSSDSSSDDKDGQLFSSGRPGGDRRNPHQ